MSNTTIWKYQLQVQDEQGIRMPYGAKMLCVQNQNGVPCLWVLCNPDEQKSERIIDLFGTGHLNDDLFTRTYIGTFQQMDGALVWHVFERHV